MTPRTFKTVEGLRAFTARRPGVWHVIVLHDDACTPSRCTCAPWYELRDLTVESYQAGIEGERAWRKAVCS